MRKIIVAKQAAAAGAAPALISFSCPQCAKKYQVAAEKAGKKIRCPNCQNVLTIPGGAQQA